MYLYIKISLKINCSILSQILDVNGNVLPPGQEGDIGIQVLPNRPFGLFAHYIVRDLLNNLLFPIYFSKVLGNYPYLPQNTPRIGAWTFLERFIVLNSNASERKLKKHPNAYSPGARSLLQAHKGKRSEPQKDSPFCIH